MAVEGVTEVVVSCVGVGGGKREDVGTSGCGELRDDGSRDVAVPSSAKPRQMSS